MCVQSLVLMHFFCLSTSNTILWLFLSDEKKYRTLLYCSEGLRCFMLLPKSPIQTSSCSCSQRQLERSLFSLAKGRDGFVLPLSWHSSCLLGKMLWQRQRCSGNVLCVMNAGSKGRRQLELWKKCLSWE